MHALRRKRCAAALLGLASSFGTSLALANDCGKPDLLEAYPGVSDPPSAVPTNATLTAHYASTAQYLGETVTLESASTGSVTVDATFDASEGLLTVTPQALSSGTQYTIHWPKLAGIGTASRGKGADVTFVVASSADQSSPTFTGLSSIDWDVRRYRDECTDSLEDRFAFDLWPGDASDDFPTEDLALIVFQTKGPHVQASSSPTPVSIQKLPPSGDSARVVLSLDDGAGRVCFAALVKDLTGKVSTGADHEVCTHTTKPPFFYGCTVSAPLASGSWPCSPSLLLLSLAARRRHRRTS